MGPVLIWILGISLCKAPNEAMSHLPSSTQYSDKFQGLYSYLPRSFKNTTVIHSLCIRASKSMDIRSSKSELLFTPRVKTNNGSRSFSNARPTLWNSPSDNVKMVSSLLSFRRHFKLTIFIWLVRHSATVNSSTCC